jgi:hypothetical protein
MPEMLRITCSFSLLEDRLFSTSASRAMLVEISVDLLADRLGRVSAQQESAQDSATLGGFDLAGLLPLSRRFSFKMTDFFVEQQFPLALSAAQQESIDERERSDSVSLERRRTLPEVERR